jgi:hypothetical protein
MDALYIALIFLTVVFVYIHCNFHLKTSNDLEVYEVQSPPKDRLEKLLDLRQPVLLTTSVGLHDFLLPSCTSTALQAKYATFEVHARTIQEAELQGPNPRPQAELQTLPLNTCLQDPSRICERNAEFLHETSLDKQIHEYDAYFRPYLVCKYMYDFIHLPKTTSTMLKHELAYRTFLVPTEGELTVKLTPPKASRYLDKDDDYEQLEFRAKDAAVDTPKVHFLQVRVKPGQVLSVPAYWWYTLQAPTESSVTCVKLQYITFGNALVMLPALARHLLQVQNVHTKAVQLYTENVSLPDI